MPSSVITLKNRADFLRLNRGRKYVTDYFILRYGPSGAEGARIGYTVTTKCGNAVIRNRIKRRLRALAAELLPELGQSGTDYVLIARADAKPNAAEVEAPLLKAALVKALTQAHQSHA